STVKSGVWRRFCSVTSAATAPTSASIGTRVVSCPRREAGITGGTWSISSMGPSFHAPPCAWVRPGRAGAGRRDRGRRSASRGVSGACSRLLGVGLSGIDHRDRAGARVQLLGLGAGAAELGGDVGRGAGRELLGGVDGLAQRHLL